MAEGFRVTYATMSADNEELHKHYDEGIEPSKAELGKTIPVVVNGEERPGEGTYELESPIDGDPARADLAGHAPRTSRTRSPPRRGFAVEWDRMGWKKHVEIINNAADLITERRNSCRR